MKWLHQLEQSLSRFAIPGLVRYVVAFAALVYALTLAVGPNYLSVLVLDRDALFRGEVWRLVTWVFVLSPSNFLFFAMNLSFMWWVGDLLESEWGTFRLNVYFFLGMASCTVATLLLGIPGWNYCLELSLIFALATLAPDLTIYLLIIPVKLKYLAYISLAFVVFSVVPSPLLLGAFVVVSLGNYIAFFGPGFFRRSAAMREAHSRRARFESAQIPAGSALHCCEVCGKTENTSPDADFRVADDGREYCEDHLPLPGAGK